MSTGPDEEDFLADDWFELDPDEQQAVRDTWDPDDRTPLDERLFDDPEAEDEDA